MATKPTIVIVPGATAPASFYQSLVDALRSHGFEATTVATLSVGYRPGPAATMYDDAILINSTLNIIADEGKEIVVVMHSYGGVPGTEGVKGTSVSERQAEGKKGGVVRLVYMTAIALLLGQSMHATFGEVNAPFLKNEDGYFYVTDFAQAAKTTISGMSFTKALETVQTMKPHSKSSYDGPLTFLGYEKIPTSFIYCSEDLILPPDLQKVFIKNIEDAKKEKIEVHEIATGHCPNVSEPEKTLELIEKIAAYSI